jgi:hypothetical protein
MPFGTINGSFINSVTGKANQLTFICIALHNDHCAEVRTTESRILNKQKVLLKAREEAIATRSNERRGNKDERYVILTRYEVSTFISRFYRIDSAYQNLPLYTRVVSFKY